MKQAHELTAAHGSPLYVYDTEEIRFRARQLQALSSPYGLTVRYAMKANPHPEIIRLLAAEGLHFDASSSFEAAQLLELGISGNTVSLSSQQPAHNLPMLLKEGIRYVATSLHQLGRYGAAEGHSQTVGLRINPGVGSGHSNRLTTGGRAASFGLWHEYIPVAIEATRKQGIAIDRLHIHVGTAGDPSRWGEIMDVALATATLLPDVSSLDIGGGYKIAYDDGDPEADLKQIIDTFNQKLTAFAAKTGRQLHLEIEPGRWLVAHGGCLLSEIVDIVDTGPVGFTFLRTNTGMNDFLRPAMYGAQHRMRVLNDAGEQADYVVVGHSCETSDILTPALHDPENIAPRSFNKAAIGDLLVISDTGAYCAAMSTRGYNAFPQAQEICI
ncbi:MAG TPA: diaminopimelate decarboxylase [Candidatus Saccharimonadales bacterium]|nr:diaminopimelate decarboxylase [Candidatus Saccharimonadales bacterium]